MRTPVKIFLKALVPQLIVKAMLAFDRTTVMVVGIGWAAAVLMMLFTIYTLHLASSAKRDAEAARVADPSIPIIKHQNVDPHNLQILLARLQYHYPEINFALHDSAPNQTLYVSTPDGSKFRLWLIALSYVDTISPQFHWSIKDLCAGKCASSDVMHATLVGEQVSFTAPEKH